MPSLNLERDLELNSDVDKVFNYLARQLRNRDVTQYIENYPAACNEVLAALQKIPQPKPLPTPASAPREEPDPAGQADQHQSKVDPHHHSSLAAKQEPSQGGRPLYHASVEDADDSSVEQTSDNSQRSANLDFWPPSDQNSDTYNQDARQDKQPSEPTVTSSTPQRLDTLQHTSSKRKQHFEDGSASKRVHIELADATESGPGSNSTGYPTRPTYEEFALRYYMLDPSLSRTSEIRDMANRILTRVLRASKSEGLDKYQIGRTEIFFRADMLAFLENLRTKRLDHCATVIQKNLKATYYRRKYLETRNAILFIQSVTRRHLAWKHAQETRSLKAATTIQRIWRGQKQRKSFDARRNNVILAQAAAKGFLRRTEIMDTRFGKAAALIQRLWRLRKHMKSWREYRRKVVLVQSLWRGKCARRRCEQIREAEASSDAVGQGNHGNDRFAELPAHWRTELQRIKSIEVIEDCQRSCHTLCHPVISIDIRPDQDALERSGGPDKIPTRDRLVKQARFKLEDGWAKEKSLDIPKTVFQVLRRIALVELTAKYEEDIEAEKAMPKKRGRPSVTERYVDLLFPHAIKYKSKNAGKGKKGGKKGRKVSDQKSQQVSEEDVRESAEKTFEYWIRLGRPLWRMSRRYGLGILVVLPKEVTETSLHALRKGQDQDVVDYIDSCHPGLKEQISNLSSLLPGIIATGLPSKRLMIEVIPCHELSKHPFEELFQFSNDHESSKLGEPPSEEPSQPSQVPMETVDARQADAAVGPSSDQGHANEQLSYAQGTRESVQNIRPDYTSESLRSRSPSADIEDGNPSNSITDYGELAHLSEKSDSRELNQQPSYSNINSEDYYDQEDDWRAQEPPDDGEREFADFKDGDLQRSGPSEAEFSDFDSFVDMQRASTPLQS